MTRRKGFTLTEVLVTVSAGSTLMVLAIGMLHQTLSISTTVCQRGDHARSANRLAQQFRADIHRATEATVTQPDRLQLQMPDESVVTFRADANRVVRLQPTADGRAQRSEFILLPNASATFDLAVDPNRAAVTITRPAIAPRKQNPANQNPGNGDIVDRKVEAIIGRLAIHESGEVPR